MKREDLLYVSDAARYLGKTEGALRMLVARELIPFRRAAGRIIFFRHEIDEWLEGAPGIRPQDLGINCRARCG